MSRSRALVMVATLAMIGSACSGSASDESGSSSSSTSASTTSTSSTASTTATTEGQPTTTTTDGGDGTTTTVDRTDDEPASDSNELAEGSGCTPGEGRLPEGEWFGFVVGIDSTSATIDFDLACWLTGDAANTASREDGGEDPVPNDYYIRNANKTTRSLPLADDVSIRYLANIGDAQSLTEVGVSLWAAARDGESYRPGIWLTIAGGEVATIEEQYVP